MKRSRLAIASLWPVGVAVAVLLAAGTAEGQTQQWTKYAGNPVLEHGEPGEWDAVVDHSEVIFDGVMYHMWYAGGLVSHETDIGYATSPDGVTWSKYKYNPVLLRGVPGEWDAGFLQPGAVIWDGALYHMWYGAGPVPGGMETYPTGYAWSDDGVTWHKHPDNPVLPVGDPGSWDSTNALITAVVADGGGFRAWYWGFADFNWMSIGYATSPDGASWTKWPEPVLEPRSLGWEGASLGFPMVVQDGGLYRMWYTGRVWEGWCQIGHAVSADGINWARQPLWEPVLEYGEPGEWDRFCVGNGRVVLAGDTAHMWYLAISYTGVFAIGYATAPLPFPEAWVFADDFESGDTSAWSTTVP